MNTSGSHLKKLQPALIIVLAIVSLSLIRCSTAQKTAESTAMEFVVTQPDADGTPIKLTFIRGPEHNHPLMAVWLETPDKEYIETLFVAESIGKGVFKRGENVKGTWQPGPVRRPAALPYWGHQRGIQAEDGLFLPDVDSPMPDAVTGATPGSSFTLNTRSSQVLTEKVVINLEINQPWDWNKHWTNNKYPDDPEYRTSSQPALVYSAVIDPAVGGEVLELRPVGHSHYSGKDGSLTEDLSTLTTALQIAARIYVTIPDEND